MIKTWFTSDTHFGHKNILAYEKEYRPFDTLNEMHQRLIDNWNSVVNKKDNIYHLGDFCFGSKNIEIADRLNGRKILIMGNHDIYPAEEYLKYFHRVYGALFYKGCLLTHIPVHPDHSRALINIHGHLHSKVTVRDDKSNDALYVNVSVEQTNLTPITFEEVQLRAYRSFT